MFVSSNCDESYVSNRQIWENIVNPNQTAPGQGLQCFFHSVCIFRVL